jgi:hypothetical protein
MSVEANADGHGDHPVDSWLHDNFENLTLAWGHPMFDESLLE